MSFHIPAIELPLRNRRFINVSTGSSLLMLAGLLLLGGWLRWTELYRQSLWEDEITSGVLAESHVRDLIWLTAHNDTHPPLYYLIAHAAYYWLRLGVVGSLRVPSLAAGVAAIAVMYLLGWKLAGRWAAAVAGAFTAISPMAVWYSHEGRMYAMTWLLVVLSYLLLAKASEGQRLGWLIAYSVTTALALWCDISAFLGVVPQVAVLAWTRPRLRVVAGYLAAFVMYSPWLLAFRSQWHLVSTQNFHTFSTWHVWSHVALAQLGLDASYAALPDLVPAGLVAVVLCAYAVVIVIGVRGTSPALAYAAPLALGPMGFGLLLAMLGSRAVLVPRVEGLSSFGVSLSAGLLVAGALRSQQPWRPAVALLSAVLMSSGSIVGLLHEIRSGTNGQPWKVWVQQLDRAAQPDDAVFILPTSLEVATHAYLPANSRINTQAMASWGGPPDRITDGALLAQGSQRERLWILYLDTAGIHIEEHDAFLRAHGFRRISGDPALPMGVLGYWRA